MQWLIDIITALFDDRHRFFDRGDPVAFDFQVGFFTQDNNWRDLDLSAIVPADAQLVLFRLVLRTNTIGDVLNLREKGNVSVFNVTRSSCPVSGIRSSYDISVAVDENRFAQYKGFLNTFDLINLTVAGWWLR